MGGPSNATTTTTTSPPRLFSLPDLCDVSSSELLPSPLTISDLSPSSAHACRLLGIDPESLIERSTQSLAKQIVKATTPTAPALKKHKQKELLSFTQQQLDKRRQGKMQQALKQREMIIRSKDSQSGGSSNRSNMSVSSDYLLDTLTRLQQQEERKQKQMVEKQKRDLQQLLETELKHSHHMQNTKLVSERVERQKQLEKKLLGKQNKEREEKRKAAAERIEHQSQQLLEAQELSIKREEEQRLNALKKKQEHEESLRRAAALKDKQRKKRLFVAQAESAHDQAKARKQLSFKIAAIELKAAAAKRAALNKQHNVKSIIKQQTNAVENTTDATTPDSDEESAKQQLDQAAARLRTAYNEAARQQKEKEELHRQRVLKAETVKQREMEEQARVAAAFAAKDQAAAEKQAEIEARRKAEQQFYEEREKQRQKIRNTAHHILGEKQQRTQTQWIDKQTQMTAHEQRLQEQRLTDQRAYQLRARLHQLDKEEHEERRERQRAFKQQQHAAKMEESQQRVQVIEQQRQQHHKERQQMIRHSNQQKQHLIKTFHKLKGALRNTDIQVNERTLQKIGIPKDVIQTVTNQQTAARSHSFTEKRERQSARDSQQSNSLSYAFHNNSTLSSPQSRAPVLHAIIPAMQEPLTVNEHLLLYVQQEQTQEKLREEILKVHQDDPQELQRLERQFAIERGIAQQKLDSLRQQNQQSPDTVEEGEEQQDKQPEEEKQPAHIEEVS